MKHRYLSLSSRSHQLNCLAETEKQKASDKDAFLFLVVVVVRSIFIHHCYQWLLLNHTKQGVDGSFSARNICFNRMFLAPFMSLSCTQPQCLHTTYSLWLSGILEYNHHATQSQQHLLKNLTKVRELGTSHLPSSRMPVSHMSLTTSSSLWSFKAILTASRKVL